MIAAFAALSLAAAAASPAALAQKVQAYYEKTADLEARFVQTYTYAAFGRSQVSKGTLRVKKPGKLRWDYEAPAKKTVLVAGSRLVQYEPEANQAYVDEHFDASAMSAAVTFLLGQGRLDKEFDLAVDGEGRLVLTPKKPDPRVERVVLTVGPGGEVTATRVEDGSGNVNAIAFEGLRRNVGLKDAVFVLDLPKDVHRVSAPGQ
ncbi:MAG: LolA family protein [Anaeromyxobacteraceae bacterium]